MSCVSLGETQSAVRSHLWPVCAGAVAVPGQVPLLLKLRSMLKEPENGIRGAVRELTAQVLLLLAWLCWRCRCGERSQLPQNRASDVTQASSQHLGNYSELSKSAGRKRVYVGASSCCDDWPGLHVRNV